MISQSQGVAVSWHRVELKAKAIPVFWQNVEHLDWGDDMQTSLRQMTVFPV